MKPFDIVMPNYDFMFYKQNSKKTSKSDKPTYIYFLFKLFQNVRSLKILYFYWPLELHKDIYIPYTYIYLYIFKSKYTRYSKYIAEIKAICPSHA